jgi:RNA polymerase sigma factor FliA
MDPNSIVSQAVVCNGYDDVERYKLFTEHIAHTVSAARAMCSRLPADALLTEEDFTSIGLTALWQQTERYNPSLGSSFWTFAGHRIRGAMLDANREEDHASRHQRVLLRKVNEKKFELDQETGREHTLEQACFALGLGVETIQDLREVVSRKFINIDAPAEGLESNGGNSTPTHAEAIADPDAKSPADFANQDEDSQLVERLLAQLPTLERAVLRLYYWSGHRMREIAAATRLTESRICQIHGQAMHRLKELAKQETRNF